MKATGTMVSSTEMVSIVKRMAPRDAVAGRRASVASGTTSRQTIQTSQRPQNEHKLLKMRGDLERRWSGLAREGKPDLVGNN